MLATNFGILAANFSYVPDSLVMYQTADGIWPCAVDKTCNKIVSK